jgi:hypothetical protein
MAHIYHADENFEGIPADVNRALIVANNGSFQFRRVGNGLIEATTKIGPGWPGDGLGEWRESLQLGFAEKISLAKLEQVVAFFREVYQRFRSEALVLLFYAPAAPEGERWTVVVPEQVVSPAHLYSEDPGPAPNGWLLAGTIHSHGNMRAYHSGTDDSDEKYKDGIHITVGAITGAPEYSCSVVVSGRRFQINLEDIVAGFEPIAFPPEWMERVERHQEPEEVEKPRTVYRTGDGELGRETLRRLCKK